LTNSDRAWSSEAVVVGVVAHAVSSSALANTADLKKPVCLSIFFSWARLRGANVLLL
jgi:hypothetical protein